MPVSKANHTSQPLNPFMPFETLNIKSNTFSKPMPTFLDKHPTKKCSAVNPLPDDKILDWSKLKQSADDNYEFDVNSKNFSKLEENTVGKGEIAHYEQFLLFPQCFQKACFPGASKGVTVWEWVKEMNEF